jgi:hypothetical protein
MNARKIFLIQEFMEGGALMEDTETCEQVGSIVGVLDGFYAEVIITICLFLSGFCFFFFSISFSFLLLLLVLR